MISFLKSLFPGNGSAQQPRRIEKKMVMREYVYAMENIDNLPTDAAELERELKLLSTANVRGRLRILRALRQHNDGLPDALATDQSLGVVVEFGQEYGVDAIAVYSDAHVFFFDGNKQRLFEGLLKDNMRPSLDLVLAAARQIIRSGMVEAQKDLPESPPPGIGLIGIVSKDGLAFGAGKTLDLAADENSKPIIRGVLEIRQALVKAKAI